MGAPALVDRSLFPQIMTLQGDRGARALTRVASSVGEVALQAPQDVDTPEDAATWLDP
jgi:CTP:molybdopterin cytidylyltransferase MocA